MDWDLTEFHMDDLYGLEKNQNMEVFSSSGVLENRILSELSEQKHSSKNPRASCLVDGCRADLSGCRDYHRRHRVCETHSKTPIVTIAGKEQRFCQQCSRKRLDGHNRRRRKSKTESTYFNYHRGTKLLHFGGGSDEEKIPSNSYARFRCVREKRFPFLLDKVNDSFFEPKAKGKGVLYLLSSSNHKMHHGSGTGPTPANNHQLQLNGSVIQQHWVNRDRIVSADWDHSLLD